MSTRPRLSVLAGLVFALLLAASASAAVPRLTAAPQPPGPGVSLGRAVPSDTPDLCPLTPGTPLAWPLGTANDSVQVVYNAQADEFVAFGLRYDNGSYADQSILGWRLSANGQPVGAPVTLKGWDHRPSLPALAHNTADNRYLVVFDSLVNWNMEGQLPRLEAYLLNADLSEAGVTVGLGYAQPRAPSVVYNSDDNEFLVVWQDEMPVEGPTPTALPTSDGIPSPTPRPTATDAASPSATPAPTWTPRPTTRGIYRARVRGDRTEGGMVLIAPLPTAADVRGRIQVAYNPTAREYLVVWNAGGRLTAQRLSHDGQPLGPAAPLLSATPVDQPRLAYNPAANQYLLVWSEVGETGGLADVVGVLLSAEGQPQGEPFVVRGTAAYETPTALVYQPTHNEYLLAWDSNQPSALRPSLLRLSASGAPLGEAVSTLGAVFALGANTVQGDYLLLSEAGARAQRLDLAPCAPTPTAAAPTTPSSAPPPPRTTQLLGQVVQVADPYYGAVEMMVRFSDNHLAQVFRLPFTAVDERLGQLAVGAKVWLTLTQLDVAWNVAGSIAVLPTDVATPTPEPSATATAAPPTDFCWLNEGTALPWPAGTSLYQVALAHNSQADEFAVLSLQYRLDDSYALVGMRLSAQGELLAGPVTVLAGALAGDPTLTYNPRHNTYLLLWGEYQAGRVGVRLLAQRLDADLGRLGEPLVLDTSALAPRVAYNVDDDEFLLLWYSDRTDPPAFVTPFPLPTGMPTPTTVPWGRQTAYTQRLRGDGVPVGPATSLVTPATPFDGVAVTVVYNSHDHEYLVAGGVYLQRLNAAGAPVGQVFRWPERLGKAGLVYNPSANEYLLVGQAYDLEPGTLIGGQRLTAAGEAIGSIFPILPNQRGPVLPAALYNPARQEYVVATFDHVAHVSASGVRLHEPVEATPLVLGVGVSASQGSLLVLGGQGRVARPLDFKPHCPTTGTPAPAPTAFTPPGLTQWTGAVEAVGATGRAAPWRVGGQSLIVTRLTHIEGNPTPGARVAVLSHTQDGQMVADALAVQTPGAPAETGTPTPTLTTAPPAATSTTTPTATATLSVALPTETATPTATATAATAEPSVTPTQPAPQYRLFLPLVAQQPVPLECQGGFAPVSSPNRTEMANTLNDVAVVSSSLAWAVGSHWTPATEPNTFIDRTLAMRWNGQAWSLVETPNVGSLPNWLNGVAALSPTDAWAVGSYIPAAYQSRTLIQHWNGTQWSVVDSPNPSEGENYLLDVAAVGPNDIWAIGATGTRDSIRPLMVHWDGTAWTRVALPQVEGRWVQVRSVSASGPNDVWVVGATDIYGADLSLNGPARTLVLHWDGAAWQRVASPNPGARDNWLEDVVALSPSDVWAVGYRNDPEDLRQNPPLVLRWDGAAWHEATLPALGTPYTELHGVAALGANDVWAVGQTGDSHSSARQTLALHWDGAAWSRVPSRAEGELNSVAALSATEVWAVGARWGETTNRAQTLAERLIPPCP